MFVERDDDGKIRGVYANRQPGYAEEHLPDDDSEVVAYLAPRSPDVGRSRIDVLENALITKGVLTAEDLGR